MRRKKRAGRAATDPGFERFSEPFPPHGALAAEGAENLLGRPRLDPLVVLVREAVQNSWDARRDDRSSVAFGLRAHHLRAEQRQQLRSHVFRDPPKAAARLRDVLTRDDLLLLDLTDAGTTGLGGPVRADRPPGKHEASNFVDLLFNIGQPPTQDLGGGTYGFGRTISFVVSEARAVVVYSRTTAGRRLESRFIAAAFSDHFTDGNRRFTGRHWWGRAVEGSIEPMMGDAADRAAAALGLEVFGADETGTTICVVAPDLGGRSPVQACRFMAGALTWNFWPKMIGFEPESPPMRFTVTLDGEPIEVSEPETVPPLHAFAAALRAVRDADGRGSASFPAEPNGDGLETSVEPVILPRTGERIGWLALTRARVLSRPTVDEGADEGDERGPSAAFEGAAHHIALVRQPELIVEYLVTAELPSVSSEYVGVFKPAAELDRAFARAEPPTHDGWNANLVPETKLRRYVGVALRTIRDVTTAFAKQPSSGADDLSVAPVTDALSVLFEDGNEQASTDRQPPLVTVEDVSLVRAGSEIISRIAFVVEHADGSEGTRIEATSHVATHDGWTVEREVPEALEVPSAVEVMGFDQHGEPRVAGTDVVVGRGDSNGWSVRVRSRPPFAVGVDLVAQAAEDGP
jgi:hypothetical protein